MKAAAVESEEGKARAVAKRNGDRQIVPASEGDAIVQMIERAARDPAVDIDKMERLFRMKLDMEARASRSAYLAALAEMQPKLPVIEKKGTIGKYEKDDKGNRTGRQEAMTKYAKWEDVVEGITPILAEHGFSLSFRVAQPTLDRIVVSGVLGHRDGHSEETAISLPIDSSGAKNNVQGWGSSVSYGKRYTAFALLNISARGEDDDGKAAGEPAFITDEEQAIIRNRIDGMGADIARFCQYLGVDGIAKIPATDFKRAMSALDAKARARR
jgi:hypothetical protein